MEIGVAFFVCTYANTSIETTPLLSGSPESSDSLQKVLIDVTENGFSSAARLARSSVSIREELSPFLGASAGQEIGRDGQLTTPGPKIDAALLPFWSTDEC